MRSATRSTRVSDALTAETAYQMVRGNTLRTAGTLAAIASGDAPPPELEVARTPRSGIALTHRVLLLFSGEPAGDDRLGGRRARRRARRRADAQRLGREAARRPAQGPLHASSARRRAARSSRRTRCALSDLALAPLDVVYGVDARPASRAERRRAERDRAARAVPGARGDERRSARARRLRIAACARPADLAAGELTLLDVLEQARARARAARRSRAAPMPKT